MIPAIISAGGYEATLEEVEERAQDLTSEREALTGSPSLIIGDDPHPIGRRMRAVPAPEATGPQLRELGGPGPRAKGECESPPAVLLCIAGEVLQITESTEKKLGANP